MYLPTSPDDPNAYRLVLGVTSYDGKIHEMVDGYHLVIDFLSNNDTIITPDVYIGTWGPRGLDLSHPCPGNFSSLYLLESDEELYQVLVFYYYDDDAGLRPPHGVCC